MLLSSRTNPYKNEGDAEKVVKQMEEFGIDALVAIGGDDTLGVAKRLHDDFGMQIIGCPKTIDNDLSATDTTFGYDTAVSIATDAIDKLQDHRQEPREDPGRRGHGPPRRLDHLGRRHRLGRERHPDPRGRARPRRR